MYMKKITILGLFLLGLGFSPLLVKADIIPTGMHPVDRCVYITNISDFPDIYLILSSTYHSGDSSQFKYYVVDKEYIDSIGIENFIPPENNIIQNDIFILENEFNSYGSYVSVINPVKKQSINYLLVKDSEGNFSLQKDKVISIYDNKYLLRSVVMSIIGLLILTIFIIIRIRKTKKINKDEVLNQ